VIRGSQGNSHDLPFLRSAGVDHSIFPLQPACPHLQSTSGVFSIAAHSVLQYFPEVTLQEQTGWAHFLLSSDAIGVSFY
jgi:hypothetical protein